MELPYVLPLHLPRHSICGCFYLGWGGWLLLASPLSLQLLCFILPLVELWWWRKLGVLAVGVQSFWLLGAAIAFASPLSFFLWLGRWQGVWVRVWVSPISLRLLFHTPYHWWRFRVVGYWELSHVLILPFPCLSMSVREKLEFGYVSEFGYWYPNSDT